MRRSLCTGGICNLMAQAAQVTPQKTSAHLTSLASSSSSEPLALSSAPGPPSPPVSCPLPASTLSCCKISCASARPSCSQGRTTEQAGDKRRKHAFFLQGQERLAGAAAWTVAGLPKLGGQGFIAPVQSTHICGRLSGAGLRRQQLLGRRGRRHVSTGCTLGCLLE